MNKKLLLSVVAGLVLVAGVWTWLGSSTEGCPSCSCDAGCCESGSCSVESCSCACTVKN